jgi:hypothetical protein
MMPAAFCNSAGTMGVRSDSNGRNFSDLRETPPPTTNRSGQRRFSRCL